MLRTALRAIAVAAVALLGSAVTASAQGTPTGGPWPGPGGGQAVLVQTDNPAGNAVDVLAEHSDGRLSLVQAVATGGRGGQTQGSVADRLASQGSLVYDPQAHLVFAVNAGSDTVSVLSARGLEVRLLQVIGSGGPFPDSIAVSGDLVYVLDAGAAGNVTGYRLVGDRLTPIPGSSRGLGLANATPPNYLTSPGEVGFGAGGSELVVTTKASTSSLDVFAVHPSGLLSSAPTVTPDPGNVPFSFTLSASGQLVVAEAGNSTLHTYGFAAGGTLDSLSPSVPDGQTALCWITAADGYYYVANPGSNDLSAYTVSPSGTPALLGPTGVAAGTDGGPIDIAASADGATIYVEAGAAGAVDEFHVNPGGSLVDLGSVAGLGAGIEGIAAD